MRLGQSQIRIVQYQVSGSGVNTSIFTDVDGVMQRLKAFPRPMRECRNGGVNTPSLERLAVCSHRRGTVTVIHA
jgi:hypothetical protein